MDTVTKLTNDLVASYARAGGINHLDGKNLPSKTAITKITQNLLRLLFPGFFDEKLVHSSEIKVETAALLDSVFGKLEDEIRKSLEYNPPADLDKKDIAPAAHRLTLEFLGCLPCIRELLQTDTEAAFNGDPAAITEAMAPEVIWDVAPGFLRGGVYKGADSIRNDFFGQLGRLFDSFCVQGEEFFGGKLDRHVCPTEYFHRPHAHELGAGVRDEAVHDSAGFRLFPERGKTWSGFEF